jgi:Uma2 family endonuclease
MRIEFSLTEKDLLAFQRHYMRSNRRWGFRLARILFWSLIFLVLVLVLLGQQFPARRGRGFLQTVPLFPLLFVVVLWVGASLLTYWAPALAVKKMLRGRNARVLEPREMSIGPEGLTTVSVFGTATCRWDALHTIDVTPDHLFLYQLSTMAFIIPRHAFPSDADFQDFVAASKQYFADAKRFRSRGPGAQSPLATRFVQVLETWLDRQPEPRGAVLRDGPQFLLRENMNLRVGLDVAYLSAGVAARQTGESPVIDGIPTLAVEFLSPSDVKEETDTKVDECLAAGVPLVWLVDPHYRTILVFRPDAPPQLFTLNQEIAADPYLPGFRVPVRELFLGSSAIQTAG